MENYLNRNNRENTNNDFLSIKVIYGIINGIQSILHLISGFCDTFYLLKEFKIYILENIFKSIKFSIKFLRYLLTFKFISNTNSRLITNIITSFGISLCLILLIIIKKEKENSLLENNKEEKAQMNLFFQSINK